MDCIKKEDRSWPSPPGLSVLPSLDAGLTVYGPGTRHVRNDVRIQKSWTLDAGAVDAGSVDGLHQEGGSRQVVFDGLRHPIRSSS